MTPNSPTCSYSHLPRSPKSKEHSRWTLISMLLPLVAVMGSLLWIAQSDRGAGIRSKFTSSSSIERRQNIPSSNDLELDFAVAGFPKCGTTFLLKVLGQHPEVTMAPGEFCAVHKKDGANQTKGWLQNVSSSSATSSSIYSQTYGIKCPTMVRSTNAIDNLAQLSHTTRIVVGVRHPVLWFESFYNYRYVSCTLYE